MKFLLLILSTAFAATAGAQGIDPELKKRLEEVRQKENKDFYFENDTTIVVPYKGQTMGANKAPGVYALPQDNMPCIVPDTKDIVAIPNAFPKRDLPKLGQIPNVTPQTGEELRRRLREFYAPPGR